MTENEQKAYELSDVLVDMVISLVDVVSEEEHEKFDSNCVKIVNCLWELARYKDLGTIEEFRALKKEVELYRNLDKTNFSDGYNKAIDEFVERLKGNTGRGLITNWDKPYGISYEKIDEIAEQMKGGAK